MLPRANPDVSLTGKMIPAGAEHSAFPGIALKVLPPYRQIHPAGLSSLLEAEDTGKPVLYLQGLSHLLLLTLFSSPAYL